MKHALTLALTAAAVFGLLVLPNHPGTLQWSALNRWPLELPVILLLMIVAGRIWGMASAVALLLVATTLLKVADYATFTAYNRTFNPILDLFLIEAGFGLFRDSVGQFAAIAAAILLGLFLVLLFLGLRFGLSAWGKMVHPKWVQAAAVAGLQLTGGWAVADVGHHLKAWSFEKSPPGTAWTSRLTIRRGLTMTETARDLAAFRKAAQSDQYQNAGGFLDKLNGHDVVLIWIESYDPPLRARDPQRVADIAHSGRRKLVGPWRPVERALDLRQRALQRHARQRPEMAVSFCQRRRLPHHGLYARDHRRLAGKRRHGL